MEKNKNNVADVQGLAANESEFYIKAERLFKDEFRTTTSDMPLKIEVSDFDIDNRPFIIIRVTDCFDYPLNGFSDVIVGFFEMVKWLKESTLTRQEQNRFIDLIEESSPYIYEYYNIKRMAEEFLE